jgi:hypothetical protein
MASSRKRQDEAEGLCAWQLATEKDLWQHLEQKISMLNW